ncbi:MAG: hypothetical protein QOH36_206 [Actinomycetota bacterium]|nr:hypothetical protein [Actinomycetota bacterium]
MALSPDEIQAIIDRDLPGFVVVAGTRGGGLGMAPPPPPPSDLRGPSVEALNLRFAGRRQPVAPDVDGDDDVVVHVRSKDSAAPRRRGLGPGEEDTDTKVVVISARDGEVVSVQG